MPRNQKKARESLRSIPIVVLTSSGSAEDINQGYARSKLINRVRKLLNSDNRIGDQLKAGL